MKKNYVPKHCTDLALIKSIVLVISNISLSSERFFSHSRSEQFWKQNILSCCCGFKTNDSQKRILTDFVTYVSRESCWERLMAGLNLSDSYLVLGSRVVHGLLNRWTDIFFLPRQAWGKFLTLIMLHKLTQPLQNFKKIPF